MKNVGLLASGFVHLLTIPCCDGDNFYGLREVVANTTIAIHQGLLLLLLLKLVLVGLSHYHGNWRGRLRAMWWRDFTLRGCDRRSVQHLKVKVIHIKISMMEMINK